MAIGILGVLSLTAASLVYYSSSNTREASRSGKSEVALNLAEAGINQALAVLNDEDNNALYTKLLDSNPATAAIDSFTSTFENGTATWSGTLDYQNMTWDITSTGQVDNPTGRPTSAVRTRPRSGSSSRRPASSTTSRGTTSSRRARAIPTAATCTSRTTWTEARAST